MSSVHLIPIEFVGGNACGCYTMVSANKPLTNGHLRLSPMNSAYVYVNGKFWFMGLNIPLLMKSDRDGEPPIWLRRADDD